MKQLHKWNVSYEEAVRIQNSLRREIRFSSVKRSFKTVGGADVSYDKNTNRMYAACVVLAFPSLEPLEYVLADAEAEFPYIPGLLSFREAPVVTAAFQKLSASPDVLICDGQGIAHPRGIGLASHLGLVLDVATIGCAKSRLCGVHGDVGPAVGDQTPLKMEGHTIGAVVRTREAVKPVFVSIGHMINLRDAVRMVLRCGRGYRLPEPTRAAHHFVTSARTGAAEHWPRRKGKGP